MWRCQTSSTQLFLNNYVTSTSTIDDLGIEYLVPCYLFQEIEIEIGFTEASFLYTWKVAVQYSIASSRDIEPPVNLSSIRPSHQKGLAQKYASQIEQDEREAFTVLTPFSKTAFYSKRDPVVRKEKISCQLLKEEGGNRDSGQCLEESDLCVSGGKCVLTGRI